MGAAAAKAAEAWTWHAAAMKLKTALERGLDRRQRFVAERTTKEVAVK